LKPDTERGLYSRYYVTRVDGGSGHGEKHEHCEYFVLDLVHDKHARLALYAYADSCRKEYPLLAKDLVKIAGAIGKEDPPTPDAMFHL
jgi:hypothetical protein